LACAQAASVIASTSTIERTRLRFIARFSS
jgi:hypothetical protein